MNNISKANLINIFLFFKKEGETTMAFISVNEIQEAGSDNSNQVKFFNLKNNNDEATVRFMYKDSSEFEILSVHTVLVGGKYRKVNCLRTAKDPVDMCPLCAGNIPLQQRFFINILEYEKRK